jgi:hypothetical protein
MKKCHFGVCKEQEYEASLIPEFKIGSRVLMERGKVQKFVLNLEDLTPP